MWFLKFISFVLAVILLIRAYHGFVDLTAANQISKIKSIWPHIELVLGAILLSLVW